MNKEELKIYLWMFFVSIIGGVLGMKERAKPCKGSRCACFFFGVIASMFVAYVSFEIAFFYFENVKFSVAISGIAAWVGTESLTSLQSIIMTEINKRINR